MPKCISDHYCILAAKNNDKIIGLRVLPYTAWYLVIKLRYGWHVKYKKTNKKYVTGHFYFHIGNHKYEIFHYIYDIYDKSNTNVNTKKLIMNNIIPEEYEIFQTFCPNLNFIFDNI